MATIHMEVESIHSAVNTMRNALTTIENQVNILGNTVNSVVGSAWIAPSANEFQSAFQEWAWSSKMLLEQLETLSQRLNAEVTEFEQNAAKLN